MFRKTNNAIFKRLVKLQLITPMHIQLKNSLPMVLSLEHIIIRARS